MATLHLPLDLDLPVVATTELATDQVAQGVGTSTDDEDWGPGIVILAAVLVIAGVLAGLFGFRSLSRKKERPEDRDR